jgi:hypothetical protein
MPERSPDQIQAEIERSRVALAQAVDQLAKRTNPKTKLEQFKHAAREKAQSTQGRIVLGAAGGLVVVLIIRRIAKH